MNFKFFPQTKEEIEQMLKQAGMNSLDDLYADVPEQIRFRGEYDLPEPMSETEIRSLFDKLGEKNRRLTVFAGAGCYDHYTPAVVPNIISRSEFLTSYTPYQAEISQGTLHYIFEYQSMMAELTGMDVSNASMYDGSTATAEAAIMALASTKKTDTVLVSASVDPKVLNVVKTYAHFHGFNVELIAENDGATDKEQMDARLEKGGVAGVIVQQPNYHGIVEDFSGFADSCHAHKSLFIVNSVAADLALLKTPGEWGADVAVGDGQSLGIPMAFGGPSVGYMCCTEKLMRKMPGRIVGKTVDNRGQRVFVLTLQAREQHIRRQKATSNICSNESLMALFVTIYMSVMGKEGVKEAAQMSYDGAHYLHDALIATGLFSDKYERPFFNEFCVKYNGDVDRLQQRFIENGILGGVKVDADTLMFAVTEKRTKEEIDKLVNIAKEEKL
ncbi:MAG: aminomethyl-transferring glycine dehydrogenase subunit GcvPA [Prevotella sp.]|uniref:aminomethyl-transferring glycine dehydrogenase subunit GcvPA n=1 Tax=Leyella stercorea TaxID=363265 RepID=UPI0025CE751B|nr:aminomethyl-transferring glycine dehydrogenase subunit GcvPA [Prevotella sp.]MDD7211648.1 aminomethyl-transferring glycine dehydrogenase subunit GcvPA [Leyella stercorea]MCI7427087.1 aminomethyl-transferring glycine dehydrogenase subunit GcvPA [Prevotella sp.]MCI7482822.1 aminomethyl-transferring glycine dehydrogenase subunit GcvPA [Prevotella sp.]MCI7652541.1 aminomethyl-transferring glycine dehydrogenase subunit GcvPA [Prevotella sp.]